MDEKLAGHLLLYCGKGALGGFKRRWFRYDDQSGQLQCFRSADDYFPLDCLDLRQALFTINAPEEGGRCHSFKVIVNDVEMLLDAETPENCIRWLQQLQQRRNRLASGRPEAAARVDEANATDLDEQDGPLQPPERPARLHHQRDRPSEEDLHAGQPEQQMHGARLRKPLRPAETKAEPPGKGRPPSDLISFEDQQHSKEGPTGKLFSRLLSKLSRLIYS